MINLFQQYECNYCLSMSEQLSKNRFTGTVFIHVPGQVNRNFNLSLNEMDKVGQVLHSISTPLR